GSSTHGYHQRRGGGRHRRGADYDQRTPSPSRQPPLSGQTDGPQSGRSLSRVGQFTARFSRPLVSQGILVTIPGIAPGDRFCVFIGISPNFKLNCNIRLPISSHQGGSAELENPRLLLVSQRRGEKHWLRG